MTAEHGEGRIRTEGFEVLQNSLTSKGEHLSNWLFRRLQQGVIGVVILGESGAGKSTSCSQIFKAGLFSGVRWSLPLITSGGTVATTEQALTRQMRQGIDFEGNSITPLSLDEEFDRSQFTPKIWDWAAQIIAAILSNRFENALRVDGKVVLIDIAGIGEKTGRLAAHLSDVAKQYPDNVVFLVVPGNPDIQDKALRLRNESNKLLSQFLQNRRKPPQITENSLKGLRLRSWELESVRDFLIRERVFLDLDPLSALISIREGARPGRFEQVRNAFLQEVIDWAGSEDCPLSEIEASLPDSFPLLNEYRRGEYGMKVAYSQYYMEKVLGISSDSEQGRVVLIPYLSTTIHHWARLFLAT